MAIKLVALDMDGTTLLPDHSVSPGVKQAIAAARKQGVHVVLCTGRPYAGVESYLRELNMDGEEDYCVTYNGALVQKASDGSTVIQTPLDFDDYTYLEALSREVGSHFHAMTRQKLYTANRDISRYTVHESMITTIPLTFCEAENMAENAPFLKVMMIDEPAVLDQAIAKIPAEVFERYNLVKSSDYFLEMLNKKVSKATAIEGIAGKLGINADEIMAVGDHENDIAMIEYAGIGVAMGNGIDKTKAVSNFVTKTNLEDGVAYAIEKFVLN